jgi:parallel beta-helix repeat protein
MTNRNRTGTVIWLIAVICSVINVAFAAQVETPMVQDLDGGGYEIYNVYDVVAKGPSADVRAYGAIGNGIADDTDAIQDAIDENRSVLIPQGYVFMVSGLVVPENRTLFGGGSLRQIAGSSSALVDVQGDNVTIRHLELDGASVGTGLPGIMADAVISNLKIINCHVHHCTHSGILVKQVQDVLISNNYSHDNAHPSEAFGDGIYISETTNAVISENIIRDNKRDGIVVTKKVADSEFVVVANNIIEGHTAWSTAAIWLELNDNNGKTSIVGNVCRGNRNGIMATDQDTSVTIVGNAIEGQPGQSPYIGDGIFARGGVVSNNTIKYQGNGIASDASNTLIIEGNHIADVHGQGIHVIGPQMDASCKLTIADNQVFNAAYGIRLSVSSGNLYNLVITGNQTRKKDGGAWGLRLDSNQAANCIDIGASVQTVSADTTVSFQETVLVNASGGPRTITLPKPANGRIVTIKKIDSSANTVTIQNNSGETIDGAAAYSLPAQWSTMTVGSDGTNWYVK